MTDHSYVCSDCGKEHEGLPTDWGFKLPDEVFELSLLEKYGRSRSNADLCTLDESRFFLRGLLSIPFAYREGEFSWGVWVEVDQAVHDFYVKNFNDDFSAGTKAKGRLANLIPGFPELMGEVLEIEFQDSRTRPAFTFQASATHPMSDDQREGIGASRHHEFLDLCGHFDESEA